MAKMFGNASVISNVLRQLAGSVPTVIIVDTPASSALWITRGRSASNSDISRWAWVSTNISFSLLLHEELITWDTLWRAPSVKSEREGSWGRSLVYCHLCCLHKALVIEVIHLHPLSDGRVTTWMVAGTPSHREGIYCSGMEALYRYCSPTVLPLVGCYDISINGIGSYLPADLTSFDDDLLA